MTRSLRIRPGLALAALVLALVHTDPAIARADDAIGRALDGALSSLDAATAPSGVLIDRVLRLSGLDRFDGSPAAPAADLATWTQAVDELRRAGGAALPDRDALHARVRAARRGEVVPIALLLARYDRLRPDAFASGALTIRDGALVPGTGAPSEPRVACLAAALRPRTFRGASVTFVVRAGDVLGAGDIALARLEGDFDDGLGFRSLHLDEPVTVRYHAAGERAIALRATLADGSRREARAAFAVASLAAPLPDDTLAITGAPYLGVGGTGSAYVRLAPGHATLTDPVVVVEGFDLDNSLGWDELYALLNQQGLVETLGTRGYDAVVLDFTEATDPVVRNGLVVAELVQQVLAAIAPERSIALVGASMGGLCTRYALAWMESQGLPHRVRTWVSFDAPHLGAVIPLGIQYWTDFFAGQSTSAAFLRDRLNTPAAREMLVHHFTVPSTSTALPDPLRATMLSEFAAAGDWPMLARRVAFANGAGGGQSQGFGPGAQIIRYEYGDLLVSIRGNVWAVPDQVNGQIFSGRIRILFSDTQKNVSVSGAQPFDGAPGGSRATMTQMDTTAVPYGDIVALHPAHCFIPTPSAVAVAPTSLFEPLASDPLILDRTPFDAVYFAPSNQEHVSIDAAYAAALVGEITYAPVAAPLPGAGRGPALLPVRPNPSVGDKRLGFRLARAGDATLQVVGVDGRAVATIARGRFEAGTHEFSWDGRDAHGRTVAAGLYFVVLDAGGTRAAGRVVHLR